jgi:hypothetical protein
MWEIRRFELGRGLICSSYFCVMPKGRPLPDYKKLDDVDIYISGNPTPEGDRAFSEYLRAYKAKQDRSKKAHPVPAARKKAKARAK